VSSPTQNNDVQILIKNHLGTTAIECSDARAKDDQAEECQEENGLNVDEETSDHAAECPVGYTVVDGQKCDLPTGSPLTARNDGGTSGEKYDVDGQTCDLNTGVPMSTRVDGGTSSMVNMHVGGQEENQKSPRKY
jgi:hypothetical protein